MAKRRGVAGGFWGYVAEIIILYLFIFFMARQAGGDLMGNCKPKAGHSGMLVLTHLVICFLPIHFYGDNILWRMLTCDLFLFFVT